MNAALKFFRSPLVQALLISIVASLSIIAARDMGHFESLELTAYDWMIRLQSQQVQPNTRIVLITITDEDIQNQGRWPLPDEILARTLRILTQNRAKSIGLDIYRDFEVPPGRQDLDEVLANNRHIITVMQFGDGKTRRISESPALHMTNQVGFNDIIVDPGGVVRRGLLYMDDGKQTFSSFALLLAMRYLEAQGITPQPDPSHPKYLRLGKTTIHPFHANDGGYVRADDRGYQFLLNFGQAGADFTTFTLSSLLSGQVPPEAVADKIVLIGVKAASVKDDFYTPLQPRLARRSTDVRHRITRIRRQSAGAHGSPRQLVGSSLK